VAIDPEAYLRVQAEQALQRVVRSAGDYPDAARQVRVAAHAFAGSGLLPAPLVLEIVAAFEAAVALRLGEQAPNGQFPSPKWTLTNHWPARPRLEVFRSSSSPWPADLYIGSRPPAAVPPPVPPAPPPVGRPGVSGVSGVLERRAGDGVPVKISLAALMRYPSGEDVLVAAAGEQERPLPGWPVSWVDARFAGLRATDDAGRSYQLAKRGGSMSRRIAHLAFEPALPPDAAWVDVEIPGHPPARIDLRPPAGQHAAVQLKQAAMGAAEWYVQLEIEQAVAWPFKSAAPLQDLAAAVRALLEVAAFPSGSDLPGQAAELCELGGVPGHGIDAGHRAGLPAPVRGVLSVCRAVRQPVRAR
jgi:hypothetical protein